MMPKRSLGSIEGRAALLHALAHIEFNAINLARTLSGDSGMPESFYRDWLQVAVEEYHFRLLRERLASLTDTAIFRPNGL